MRPIDADALKDFINRQLAMTANTAVVMNAKDFFENIVDNAPTIDAVSRGVHEQVMWERDLAISQLNEIGKSWGEKMDNVATVVRCKDCISFDKEGICQLHEINRSEDDFCSDGSVGEASICDYCDERSENCCWCKKMERSDE